MLVPPSPSCGIVCLSGVGGGVVPLRPSTLLKPHLAHFLSLCSFPSPRGIGVFKSLQAWCYFLYKRIPKEK